jgi:hypothetical protein
MLVFREDRHRGNAGELVRMLCAAGDSAAEGERVTSALIVAGMLESALDDADADDARVAEQVTDELAEALAGERAANWSAIRGWLDRIDGARALRYSAAEGFAYYDLHPLQYSAAATAAAGAETAAVIGIRSIGSALSASLAAGLRRQGVRAERVTVRPGGHPFDRRTRFSIPQKAWVERHRERGSRFLVADEGPGLSGSSFLSTGDALTAAGVPLASITFVCSAAPEVGQLRAPDGARRWTSFRTVLVPPRRRAWQEGAEDWGGGLWRASLFASQNAWPGSWVQFERKKFLLAGGRHIAKFEGLGYCGEAALARAALLAGNGFSPEVQPLGDGYLQYQRWHGRPASRAEISASLLERMAEYAALRAREFSVGEAETASLEAMLRCNLEEEFGEHNHSCRLAMERPAIVDGRMLPHEWVGSPAGWTKVDAAGHGNDHFYPGPADIAWDLGGAAVEWQMTKHAAEYMVEHYEKLTDDKLTRRLPQWTLAYAAFRMAYCKMAADALAGTPEEKRLRAGYRRYRECVLHLHGGAERAALTVAPPRRPGASQHL